MARNNASPLAGLRRGRRAWARMLAALLLASLTLAAPYVASGRQEHTKHPQAQARKVLKGLPIAELSEDEAILHALNRLGFGPRPGDVERVRQMGLKNWIEQQLNPASIDDAVVEARLERYPTLKMTPAKLLEEFPQPKQAAKRAGLTPEQFRTLREEKRDERQRMNEGAQAAEPNRLGPENPAISPEGAGRRARLGAAKRQGFAANPDNAPLRFEELRTPQRIIAELSMAKMTRAIYSKRQLYEHLVDFWFNHFNVFAGKGADRWLVTSYEREVIRPRAMGKFEDLLSATAKSSAMLFYLDNWLSADPKAFVRMERQLAERRQRLYGLYGLRGPLFLGRLPGRMDGRMGRRLPQDPGAGRQPGQPALQRRERGLNENYARELMELHTVGVDGGYTQQDVVEVARCFTGWTMRAPRRDPEFFFDERIHDPDAKVVLGYRIHAGGMKDGEEVLHLLAHRPSTAKFISMKLAQHFVADDPPLAIVDRMAKTFLATDGDIRAVLRAMVYSPEFWSRQAYRAKIKTPFELVASAARALSADVDVPLPLVMWTARIGEPLYLCQPPTGYSDKAESWVNTGALLNRLNFAMALASNRLRGTQVDVASLLGSDAAADPKVLLARAIQVLLDNQASPRTRNVLEKQLADPKVLEASLEDPIREINPGVVAGLVLGAPEFQRR